MFLFKAFIALTLTVFDSASAFSIVPPPSSTTLRPTTFSHTTTATATITRTRSLAMADSERYTIPDQPARFARAKAEQNERYLDIDTVYDGSYLKGKRVAITGANRGVGLSLAKELKAQGGELIAICRSTSDELEALNPTSLITGVDFTSDEQCDDIASQIAASDAVSGGIGGPIDILINNAGYFYEPEEKIDSLNFKEELKMIDICALGPLRVSANLYNNGLLKEGSVIAMITSQGGSISWRTTQNPQGKEFLCVQHNTHTKSSCTFFSRGDKRTFSHSPLKRKTDIYHIGLMDCIFEFPLSSSHDT